jgi:thiamine transporter ThiT
VDVGGGRPSDGDGRDGGSAPDGLVVGLLASPGPATELTDALLPELPDHISARLPDANWVVCRVSDRLVERPADLNRLITAARRRMLDEGWHLAVCITDLPLQTSRRPVVAHVSMTHGVAVLSLPALGAVGVAQRATEAIVRLVAGLVGDNEPTVGEDGGRRRIIGRRLRELVDREDEDGQGFGLVAGVVTGNLRLLLGMLRANRPWQLALRLSRALVAALTAGVFALVTSDIWRLGDHLGAVRLTLIAIGSVVAVVATIVIGAGLWERAPPERSAREQVALFNIVTLTTVVIGVLALYLALLILTVIGALLLVPRGLLADAVGHGVGVAGVLELAWLATSVATIGGALGAGLESDEAVQEAAYSYQPDTQLR